jgi:hypothetical protein
MFLRNANHVETMCIYCQDPARERDAEPEHETSESTGDGETISALKTLVSIVTRE